MSKKIKIFQKASLEEQIKLNEVLKSYQKVGDNRRLYFYKNTLAFVNQVYLIESKTERYILRESRRETDFKHLLLEVDLLNYLQKKRFPLSPQIIHNDNNQYVTCRDKVYYIMQTCLPGETKANWDNLDLFTINKLKSFFRSSALFTRAVQNYQPYLKVKNQTLLDIVKTALIDFRQIVKEIRKSQGHKLILKNQRTIQNFIINTQKDLLKSHYNDLPRQLIHFDFHPGNVNFIKDQVSGIFDYDWARFDSRITDLAGTIAQSCYYWGGLKGGLYRKERIKAGLRAYRQEYGKSEFNFKEENYLIKITLKGYLVFQLLFTLSEYAANIKSRRHLATLEHFCKLILINDFDFLLNI